MQHSPHIEYNEAYRVKGNPMMKRVFWILSLCLLLTSCAKANDNKPAAATPTPTYPPAITYQGATLTPMGDSLAADGQRLVLWLLEHAEASDIVWVCVVNINTHAPTCNPTPERFTPLASGLMVWSPDGRYLAFHTDWAVFQQDTDLHVVDVESATLLNLTGLPTEERRINDVRQGAFVLIDYAPFWSPDGAYLYFLRLQPQASEEGEGYEWGRLTLMRVQVSDWAYEAVMTLPEAIDPLRLIAANQISASPDGSQLAILLNRMPTYDGTTDLWRLNLKTQTAELWVPQADLVSALPPFVNMAQTAVYAHDVQWVARGQQVVVIVIADLVGTPLGRLMVYNLLDVATNIVSPLDDLRQYETMRDFVDVLMTWHMIVAADGSTLFRLVGQPPRTDEQTYSVVAHPLMPVSASYTVAEIVVADNLLRASRQERYTHSIQVASTNGNVWLQYPSSQLSTATLLSLQ